MKTFWKIAGIATLVAVLGVAAVGAVAFAQDDDGAGWPFDFRQKFREAMADILGITVEKYDAAVEQAHEQVLDEAVTEGWLTEDQAERMRERTAEGFGPGMRGGKFGPGRGGFMGGPENSFISIAAEALDMTAQDLLAELKDGKSIAAVAEEKGMDTQIIVDTYLDQLADNLDTAVEEGRITQERADWMLEQAEQRVTDMLDTTWEDCVPGGWPGDFRRGGHPGEFQGFPGQTDA